MFVAEREWRLPTSPGPDGPADETGPQIPHCSPGDTGAGSARRFYGLFAGGVADETLKQAARELVARTSQSQEGEPCELPEAPQDLAQWMQACSHTAKARYREYLDGRRAGGPRRYFTNRAHALHFLRSVSPTKLVDGAWLYGLLPHAQNLVLAPLVHTYLEELGDGVAAQNHVCIYRRLMARYGLELPDDLDDGHYLQGAIQLALGCNAETLLPEVIGFNLGYEQLPLHLLITAYELDELGIDPYYFTLHVTIDNAASGHAHHAVQVAQQAASRHGVDFWRRMRRGFLLSGAGVDTPQVIAGFDIGKEVVRILARKSPTGCGAHSDYCRIGGRHVNDWLARPEEIPAFIAELEANGWIRRNETPQESRFWRLLQGERAPMFGVFTPYELQVIFDWIRGTASVDGRAWDAAESPLRSPRFRAAAPQDLHECPTTDSSADDPEVVALRSNLAKARQGHESLEWQAMLIRSMSPGEHWTPAGLKATRLFRRACC